MRLFQNLMFAGIINKCLNIKEFFTRVNFMDLKNKAKT